MTTAQTHWSELFVVRHASPFPLQQRVQSGRDGLGWSKGFGGELTTNEEARPARLSPVSSKVVVVALILLVLDVAPGVLLAFGLVRRLQSGSLDLELKLVDVSARKGAFSVATVLTALNSLAKVNSLASFCLRFEVVSA